MRLLRIARATVLGRAVAPDRAMGLGRTGAQGHPAAVSAPVPAPERPALAPERVEDRGRPAVAPDRAAALAPEAPEAPARPIRTAARANFAAFLSLPDAPQAEPAFRRSAPSATLSSSRVRATARRSTSPATACRAATRRNPSRIRRPAGSTPAVAPRARTVARTEAAGETLGPRRAGRTPATLRPNSASRREEAPSGPTGVAISPTHVTRFRRDASPPPRAHASAPRTQASTAVRAASSRGAHSLLRAWTREAGNCVGIATPARRTHRTQLVTRGISTTAPLERTARL
jgi:hypothetical protein